MGDYDTFFQWLLLLDVHVSMISKRIAIPLADSCSAHGRHGILPDTFHVQELLPLPNTTSRLQSLNTGGKDSLKATYKQRKVQKTLSLADMNKVDMYNVGQLKEKRWLEWRW